MMRVPMPGLSLLTVSKLLEAHMADRGWHKVDEKWSRSLGERGLRVRLFQNRRGGVFFRAVYLDGQKDRMALGTTDRREAERLGRSLLAELRQGQAAVRSSVLTLGQLWNRYRLECPAFLDNAPHTRADTARRALVLLAYLGHSCEVDTLTANDIAAYSSRRRVGGIRVSDEWTTGAVRARSVEADLVVLFAMLSWALTVRVTGRRLLTTNPLAGVRRVREPNPHRPVATWDRYQATRASMQEMAAKAESDSEGRRWTKMELALVLAERTGRRLGAIRQLRWEDVLWERREIRWRAEADKKRREWIVPTPESLLDELRQFQRRLGAVGGWVFAAERNPAVPMDRHLFDRWLVHAERKAKLPKLEGGLWHPYRRKWATERKHLSITDVAAAGGWQDTATLLTCYQQPTNDALLAVMSEERKVRDVAGLAARS
jgi:integrase